MWSGYDTRDVVEQKMEFSSPLLISSVGEPRSCNYTLSRDKKMIDSSMGHSSSQTLGRTSYVSLTLHLLKAVIEILNKKTRNMVYQL